MCAKLSSQDWRPHRAAAAQCAMEAFIAGITDPDVVNGFGVWGLLWGEWVADVWHRNYEGAPEFASAWVAEPPRVRGVSRGFPNLDGGALAVGLRAVRARSATRQDRDVFHGDGHDVVLRW